jgi:hypothetical protein
MIMQLRTKGICEVTLALGKQGGIAQFYTLVLLRLDVSALGWVYYQQDDMWLDY